MSAPPPSQRTSALPLAPELLAVACIVLASASAGIWRARRRLHAVAVPPTLAPLQPTLAQDVQPAAVAKTRRAKERRRRAKEPTLKELNRVARVTLADDVPETPRPDALHAPPRERNDERGDGARTWDDRPGDVPQHWVCPACGRNRNDAPPDGDAGAALGGARAEGLELVVRPLNPAPRKRKARTRSDSSALPGWDDDPPPDTLDGATPWTGADDAAGLASTSAEKGAASTATETASTAETASTTAETASATDSQTGSPASTHATSLSLSAAAWERDLESDSTSEGAVLFASLDPMPPPSAPVASVRAAFEEAIAREERARRELEHANKEVDVLSWRLAHTAAAFRRREAELLAHIQRLSTPFTFPPGPPHPHQHAPPHVPPAHAPPHVPPQYFAPPAFLPPPPASGRAGSPYTLPPPPANVSTDLAGAILRRPESVLAEQ